MTERQPSPPRPASCCAPHSTPRVYRQHTERRLRPWTIHVAAIAILGTSLGGCLGERYHKELHLPHETQESYVGAAVGDARAPESKWWQELDLPGLDAAIEEAFENNLDLRGAWLRIDEARTFVTQAESGWWPQVNANASVTRAKQPIGAIDAQAFNQFQLGVDASYELDLWGRTLANYNAAELDVRAVRADVETAAFSLSAQITEAWLNVLFQRERRLVLDAQIELAETFRELSLMRLNVGQASALDVLQQEQNLDALDAQRPLIDAEEEIALTQLAILMGRDATDLPDVPGDRLPSVPSPVGVGVPADLLEQRPDVRAARMRAEAANARIVVAIADRLPSVRLSASIFLNAANPADLFDDIFWSVAAALTVPLIDGGRRAATVERAELQLDQTLLTWASTLQRAIQEVQVALVRERQQALFVDRIDAQIERGESTLETARLQFASGVSTYDRVIAALNSLQGLESSRVDARRQLLSHRITLYRALGGTWTQELDAPPRPDPSGQASAAPEGDSTP